MYTLYPWRYPQYFMGKRSQPIYSSAADYRKFGRIDQKGPSKKEAARQIRSRIGNNFPWKDRKEAEFWNNILLFSTVPCIEKRDFSKILVLKWLQKVYPILKKQEQDVIFTKGPNFVQGHNFLFGLTGLSWKELATLTYPLIVPAILSRYNYLHSPTLLSLLSDLRPNL